jgi:hypothetical protein
MILTAGELADIRADMAATLPDTCTITSTPGVQNDSGGWSDGTPVATDIACRLGPVAGRERVLGGRVVEESDAVLTLPHDAEVAGADTITHDGTVYQVVDVLERSEMLAKRVFVRATS